MHNYSTDTLILLFLIIAFYLFSDGSFEYTDSTGTDLHDFIIKTLKNPR